MYVRMISFGTGWWEARDADHRRRKPAWFNSSRIKSGRRFHFCLVLPGQVRFNQRSGFHPSFPGRAIGQVFLCDEPRISNHRIHLLVRERAPKCEPDAYLVTVADGTHGQILFDDPEWRSHGVQPIAVSLRRDRYEAILIMGQDDWVRSDLGLWKIAQDGCSLRLATGQEGETVA